MIRLVRDSLSLAAILGVLLACKALDKSKEGTTSATAPATSAPGTTTATAATAGAKTNLNGPKDTHGVDLAKIFGTKADGWKLPVSMKLKEDMTPVEVGKVVPGAEKIDNYGFSEVKKTDVKGVSVYKFSFQDSAGKKGLKFVTIELDPQFKDEPFWTALVSHLQQKLGGDMTDHGDHHVQWIGPDFVSWSLSKGITHEGFELQAAIGK